MKRKLAFFLALVMLFLSLGEPLYALGLDEGFKEEKVMQTEGGGKLFSQRVMEVRSQGAGGATLKRAQSPRQARTPMGQNQARDQFTAWVKNASGLLRGDVNSANKSDTYTIEFPVMNLKTSSTGPQTYSITIAKKDLVASINGKASSPYASMKIVDVQKGTIVGKIEVVEDGDFIVAKYTFDKTDVVTYTTSPLTLKLTTNDLESEKAYTLLPGSSNEVKINFFGFNIAEPTLSEDKKSATVTISEKTGYQLGNISVNEVPATADYTRTESANGTGKIYTYKLKDGKTYASFNETFKNEAQSTLKTVELGTKPGTKPTYTAGESYDFKIDGDNLLATITLTKDTKDGAPNLPDNIEVTSFNLTNGANANVKDENRLKITDDCFESYNQGLYYKLKETQTINGTTTDEGKTKTYKLEIPVSQWMTFKNDYSYLTASWNFKYSYNNKDQSQNASKTITFLKESIGLKHEAKVAPSADTGENFLYESLNIYPANGKTLPDGFTIKISNREVLFPANVKSDNKFELAGKGVEKKDPWTGYDIKGDKTYTYNGGDKKYQIVKIDEKDEHGEPTGKFHYRVEWKTKVTKLPNNYWNYGNPGARSKANISYTYQGQNVTSPTNQKISFFQIAPKPSDKVQIDQTTNDKGERITTWAIVFNRDHKKKAVTEISDTLRHGTFVENSLNYYFIKPDQEITRNGKEIKTLLEGKTPNKVATDYKSAKPFYTITKDVEEGKDRFVIKFGDHSNTLSNKIAEINAKYPNYATDKKQASKMNIEIIQYIFPDYVYKEKDAGTKITSNGAYFKDTKQGDTGRNFPNLSHFKTDISAVPSDIPFTVLTNSYIKLKKAEATEEEKLAFYLLEEDKEEKSDALIVTYQTKSDTKPEDNSYDSKWFSEYPPVTIIETNKKYKKLKDLDGLVYPQLSITGPDTEDETGEKKGTNEQTGLYPVAKYSFIDNDMTLIKNGVLANIKGSYCEEIEIKDLAHITGGKIEDKYTGLKLVRFKLADFDAEIAKLKEANPKPEGKSEADYEKELYTTFITKYIKGDLKLAKEEVKFQPSDDNKTINFTTGVNEEGFNTNKEANQFVYLFTYDMDASYNFVKIGGGNATAQISNTASVTYDQGLEVKATSSLQKKDFLTKEDITSDKEAKTSGKKTYRLTFDFTGYELKDIKEVEITDTFGAYDQYVEITGAEKRGALKAKTNDTDPDVYEADPADITVSREGKVFTVKSDKDLSGKKFTIIYKVKMDLSKIYDGSSGEKTVTNKAIATLKNNNNPPQTIIESATASTTVQYGKFLTKTVNTWEKVTPAENASEEDKAKAKEENKKREENFKQSSLRHYTLTFDLKGKDFLKNADSLTVKDTFGSNHKYVKYKNVLVKEGNADSTGLKVRTLSSGTSEIVFEVTKANSVDSFPDKFTLEYDVVLQNGEIAPNEKQEYPLVNYANATFKDKQTSYTQNASTSTPVKSGTMEVSVGMFTLNLNKVLPDIKIGRDIKTGREKVKDKDYSGISFSIEGKYNAKDKNGTKTEKNYNAKTLKVSEDGSLVFDDIPFDGTYTLTEKVTNPDYQELKSEIKFTVSEDGSTITFDSHCIDKNLVEVTKVNDNSNPTVEQEKDGDLVKKDIVKVVQPDKWGFVVQMDMNIHNKVKPVEKHTLIFKKIDTTTEQPLQGAVFKIEKLGDEENNSPVYKESDKDGIVKFENLPNGKYKVTETATAPGRYSGSMASFPIELTEDMAAEYDYGDVENTKLTKHDISFIKAEIQNKGKENENIKPLPGAEFELMKKGSRGEFAVYKTAKSDSNGKVTFTGVEGGTYKIVESKAPVGYGLPEDTTVKVPKETPDIPWFGAEDDEPEEKTDVFEVKEDKDATYYDWSYEHEIRILPPGYTGDLLPTKTIKQLVVENTKIKHRVSFTKYQEVYKGKPIPMAGATFILKANGQEVARAVSDQKGLVKFENLDNKDYQIVEAPEDKERKTNLFSDHVVNTDVIHVPDLTNARDKAQDIKLFTDEDKVNRDEKFVNYKDRKGFSFKKYDEALDENGQKLMKGVEFKAYRKVGNDFEKEVYKCLKGTNPARQDFKDAVAVSDAEGNVVFTGFEPGTYKIVETRVAGYENLSFEITVSKDGVKFPKNIEDNSVEKIIDNGDGTQKKEKTYIVKNAYTRHEVIFKKVDKFSGTGLEGAVFKVEKLEKDGTYTLISDKVTSNPQGLVSIPGLFNGEYRITEIKTPSGYKESDVSFKFTLADSDLPQVEMKDVKNERNIGFIYLAPEEGLLNKRDHAAYMYGYPDGSFKPNRLMTRAEATAMFGRLLVKKYTESREYRPIYSDVKKDQWCSSAITIMTDLKLVSGYPDGTFKPNAPITRAEFATIASRFDKLTGGTVNFKDLSSSHWAYPYIASAYNKGWVTGYPDGSFRPEKGISREEVVAITNRMLDRKCDLDFVRLHKKDLKMFFDNPETSWSYGDIIEATNGHDYHRKYENLVDEVWERLNGKEFHI